MSHPETPADSPTQDESPAGPVETWFTIQEAIDATGSSRSTIKRRLRDQDFPNARQSDGSDGFTPGTWFIPKSDLLEAGFKLFAPLPGDDAVNDRGPKGSAPLDQDREPVLEGSVDPSEVARLKDELSQTTNQAQEWRRRAEIAEAIAEERRQRNEDLRTALRMLEAGPVRGPTVVDVRDPVGESTAQAHNRMNQGQPTVHAMPAGESGEPPAEPRPRRSWFRRR